jgi:TonB-dependent receptor
VKQAFLQGLLFITPLLTFAQSGKITGKVIDAGSGQSLSSATVMLLEKSIMQVADLNGNFNFNKLPAGTYSIKCSYGGYVEKIVDEIIVKEDENIPLTISLEQKRSDSVVIKSTIRVRAAGETVASLLIAQKNMANVSDGISAESIRKTPDRSTSDVLKRVSGASIQDDRFAIIRGLNDRYNAAFINGAPLPSTESDRKAFAFDIFPSAILDNLVIYKTATPDKGGEFAGGMIDITTKSILSKGFTSITIGGSCNTLITGKNRFFSENKGKKDWIGIDDGTRAIPAGIPSARELKLASTFVQKGEYAKLFGDYKWGIKKGSTGPNFNFQASKGFNVLRREQEFFGFLFSVNYNRNFTFTEGDRDGYEFNTSASTGEPIHRAKYKDSIYNDEVVLAALANVAIKINNRNSISWKNNLSINTDNKLIKRIGPPDVTSDSAAFVKDAVRWFTSNKIFSSQLTGEHQVGNKKTKINWLAAYSKVNREIPNLSRTSYSGRLPDLSNLTATIIEPPSQTHGSGTMFFSSSDENIKSIKTDITQPYTFMKNSQNFIKIGAGYQVRERSFTSRVLGFTEYNDNSGTTFDNSLTELPEDQIFLRDHMGKMKNGQGGFLLSDGTLANSDYTASSALTHVYIMNDQRFFKKFRLIYGARLENFNQKLNTVRNLSDTIRLNTIVKDFLPSVNLVYALTSKMNVRLSYAITINRPEFRELAPFLFFENQTNFLMEGDPNLKRAKINNYDFRYEFFPGKAQLFSISAFYKGFTDPIELVSLPNTSSQTIYENSKSAKVYGLEAEFRTLVSTLFGIKRENTLLNKFTLSANAAYTKSNVKLDSIGLIPPEQLATDRALQGQSPYIINGSLGFNDDRSGLSSTLSVNRVGDRIFIAGTYQNADIYEKARTVIDFQLAKFFLHNALELKFTVRDILAQKIIFYSDFDKSKTFTGGDKYFSTNTAPTVISFSATFKF